MDTNAMNPDQSAPLGAVLFGLILFAIYAFKIHKQTTLVVNAGERFQTYKIVATKTNYLLLI